MLKFNKQLTALALLTVTSVAGTMLTISNASATPKQSQTVTDVILKDKESGREFTSNNGVPDLSKVGFNNKADSVGINNGEKWRFYEHKNFKGQFVEVGPDEFRGNLGHFNNKISSFCALKNCPK
jgi:hypothetical protein